ncbi:MAG TPA: hypothetical protein VN428_23890 [Bryobacteraceae bacterium]|nr:hypothetical protein [Bryobacteraceae bacterium]
MKTTIPLRPGAFNGEVETTCSDKLADAHLSGNEQIQGLSVEKIESDDDEAKATVYAAPLLGCLHVRSAYYWKGPDGKVVSSTVEEPVEIKLSAPDPKLFEVPPDYREVTPAERKNAMARYFDGKPDR